MERIIVPVAHTIGENDVETLIMADEFRSEYLKTQVVYTNKFILDGDSGEFLELFDADMEHLE